MEQCNCEDCKDITNQFKKEKYRLISIGEIEIPIGTKLYRPAWNLDGEPCIFEETIISYRNNKTTGKLQTYVTNKGGYSKNSIGKNTYLSLEEAEENRGRKIPANLI